MKRLISSLLVIAMCISFLPAAFAADAQDSVVGKVLTLNLNSESFNIACDVDSDGVYGEGDQFNNASSAAADKWIPAYKDHNTADKAGIVPGAYRRDDKDLWYVFPAAVGKNSVNHDYLFTYDYTNTEGGNHPWHFTYTNQWMSQNLQGPGQDGNNIQSNAAGFTPDVYDYGIMGEYNVYLGARIQGGSFPYFAIQTNIPAPGVYSFALTTAVPQNVNATSDIKVYAVPAPADVKAPLAQADFHDVADYTVGVKKDIHLDGTETVGEYTFKTAGEYYIIFELRDSAFEAGQAGVAMHQKTQLYFQQLTITGISDDVNLTVADEYLWLDTTSRAFNMAYDEDADGAWDVYAPATNPETALGYIPANATSNEGSAEVTGAWYRANVPDWYLYLNQVQYSGSVSPQYPYLYTYDYANSEGGRHPWRFTNSLRYVGNSNNSTASEGLYASQAGIFVPASWYHNTRIQRVTEAPVLTLATKFRMAGVYDVALTAAEIADVPDSTYLKVYVQPAPADGKSYSMPIEQYYVGSASFNDLADGKTVGEVEIKTAGEYYIQLAVHDDKAVTGEVTVPNSMRWWLKSISFDGKSEIQDKLVALRINKSNFNLYVNDTAALKVTEVYEIAGAVESTLEDVEFVSDAEDVATVSAEGVITAVGAGAATITVTKGDCSIKCTVFVESEDSLRPLNYVFSHAAFGDTEMKDTYPELISFDMIDTTVSSGRWGNADKVTDFEEGEVPTDEDIRFRKSQMCAQNFSSWGIHRTGNFLYTTFVGDIPVFTPEHVNDNVNNQSRMLMIEVPTTGEYVPNVTLLYQHGPKLSFYLIPITEENEAAWVTDVAMEASLENYIGTVDPAKGISQSFPKKTVEAGNYYLFFTPNGASSVASGAVYLASFNLNVEKATVSAEGKTLNLDISSRAFNFKEGSNYNTETSAAADKHIPSYLQDTYTGTAGGYHRDIGSGNWDWYIYLREDASNNTPNYDYLYTYDYAADSETNHPWHFTTLNLYMAKGNNSPAADSTLHQGGLIINASDYHTTRIQRVTEAPYQALQTNFPYVGTYDLTVTAQTIDAVLDSTYVNFYVTPATGAIPTFRAKGDKSVGADIRVGSGFIKDLSKGQKLGQVTITEPGEYYVVFEVRDDEVEAGTVNASSSMRWYLKNIKFEGVAGLEAGSDTLTGIEFLVNPVVENTTTRELQLIEKWSESGYVVADPETYMFESLDEAVATVDEYGVVSAIADEGIAEIVATSFDDEAITASTFVTAIPKFVELEGVEFAESSIEVEVEAVGSVQATVVPSNATENDIVYSTEDTDIISLDAATGEFVALAEGVATITATAGEFTATCVVTVKAPIVEPEEPEVPEVPVINPTFTSGNSASLLLEDNVLLNVSFAMDGFGEYNPADLGDRVGLLIFNAGDVTEETATMESASIAREIVYGGSYYTQNGAHRFNTTTEGIAAKNLGDNLSVRPFFEVGDGTYVYGRYVASYSPKKYCYNKIKENSDAGLTKLCVAILNYGAAAQTYFNYNTSDMMNSDLTADQKTLVWDGSLVRPTSFYQGLEAKAAPELARNSAVVTGRGGVVGLEGAIECTFYIRTTGVEVEKVELLSWSEAVVNSASELTEANATEINEMVWANNRYEYVPQGLPAKRMFETLFGCAKVTATDGSVYYGGVLAYSPERNATANADKTSNSVELRDLVKRMINYGDAARSYFAK